MMAGCRRGKYSRPQDVQRAPNVPGMPAGAPPQAGQIRPAAAPVQDLPGQAGQGKKLVVEAGLAKARRQGGEAFGRGVHRRAAGRHARLALPGAD